MQMWEECCVFVHMYRTFTRMFTYTLYDSIYFDFTKNFSRFMYTHSKCLLTARSRVHNCFIMPLSHL